MMNSKSDWSYKAEGPSFQKKCLIVDDEPNAIFIIEEYLRSYPNLHLVASVRNAMDALAVLRAGRVDLLFLDIQMPGITGFQLLESLEAPPAVIITSAHRNYAVDAFDFKVLDYLLKPISLERFARAVDRYFELLRATERDEPLGDTTGSVLVIRSERKEFRIPFREILFLEAMGDYVAVRLTNGEKHLTLETLSGLAHRVPSNEFARIHRSFVVNRRYIRAIGHHSIKIGGQTLPVGRNYRPLI
ncbi:MAG: LytTR family DNA-binding domain-containing protein [Bacteroidales bacterium]